MRKVFHVALREFKATVLTKGFLIGVLIVPLLMLGAIPAAVLLTSSKPPPVRGTVSIIDRSGEAGQSGPVGPILASRLSPDSVGKLLDEEAQQVKEVAKKALPEGSDKLSPGIAAAPEFAAAAIKAAAPALNPVVLAPDADPAPVKDALRPRPRAENADAPVALVVIAPDAVHAAPDKAFGTYELFVRAKLDARVQGLLRTQIRESVLEARLTANGEDPARIQALTRLKAPETVEITSSGEKTGSELRQLFVPLGFMMLLWISTLTGGQFLLTSTIEEKSNRVMEVLLSAVSPMQLMTGKILGQMAASMCILLLYSGTGISALIFFAQQDLIDWVNLLYLVCFFFIAFFTLASLMAAIGSAVTDIHEAQALMTPVMLVIMTPMLLMMPIISNPKGNMATAMSFIPIINPFVMVLRIASTDPPPPWQILAALAVGAVTVLVMLRLAAKVFRVGVLMYGKPPNIATLIRWIRMA